MRKYLEGDKIKLVKFADPFITGKYLNWLNDHQVNRYLITGRFPVTRGNVFAPDGEKNLMFAMMSNIGAASDDKLWQDTDYNHYVGTCSLHDIDWITRKGEVGYMLGEKTHWGAGLTTEVVKLITEYAFERLNLNKLTAGVVDGNEGSIKVLEKNGYKKFATNEKDYYLEGKFLDVHRFHNFQEWYYGSKP
jgi:RimJ/RimL family protein N-acetyltransferase